MPFGDGVHQAEKRGQVQLVAKTKLIVNRTRGDALCVGELADGPLLRMRGLLGRSGLPAGEGLLLSPAPGIHTAFMRFPIDALFLDRELRVIEIVEKLRPWRMASKRKAWAVLELAAGECARCGVQVGDTLELRERARDRHNGNHHNGNRPSLRPRGGSSNGDAPSTPRRQSRLAPLRVIVASPDRHYRTAISLLVARRNCSVTVVAGTAGLAERVAREQPDVVLLDAALGDVSRVIAKLEALSPPTGVVIVAGKEGSVPPGRMALPKWGTFGELMEAIERSRSAAAAGGIDDE
jgi:uncharacterized protein